MTRKERVMYLNQLIIPDLFDNSQEACELRINQETALRETIEELMQEPCDDAISRDKAIVQLSQLLSDWNDDWNVAIRKCIETVKIVQPVTPTEKVGQWIRDDNDYEYFWRCNKCSKRSDVRWKYCPYCSTKMQEVKE